MFLEIFILFKRFFTDSASRAVASLHVLFQLGYSFKYRLASYAWSSFICKTEVKLSSILDTMDTKFLGSMIPQYMALSVRMYVTLRYVKKILEHF